MFSLGAKPSYIFVSDYRNDENIRTYSNLWVFSDRFMSEARDFVSSNSFDYLAADSGISYLEGKNFDFGFDETIEKSR